MFNNESMQSMNPSVNGSTSRPKKRIKVRTTVFTILVILTVFGLYGTVHYYRKYKALTADPNAEAQKMTQAFVATLGKLMELPKDETPTVATISDKEKLTGQAFFTNAENGDILFAYTNAMKAILYRPTTNKIINVAPISINQPESINTGTKQGVPTVTPATTQSANVPATLKTPTPAR